MSRVALFCCARISKRHSELLGHGQLKGACLAAVVDIVTAKAEVTAAPFDVSWFTDMHEMMERVQPDIVVVLIGFEAPSARMMLANHDYIIDKIAASSIWKERSKTKVGPGDVEAGDLWKWFFVACWEKAYHVST